MRRSDHNYNHNPIEFDNFQNRQLFAAPSIYNPTRAMRPNQSSDHAHVLLRYSIPVGEFSQHDDEVLARLLQAQESFGNISINEGQSDEAIARVLQEMEYGGVENLSINETYGFADGNVGSSLRVTPDMQPIQPIYQDDHVYQNDVDPDNMNYEELTELGESIGNVSIGLSESEISRLRSHTYKKSSSRRSSSSANEHNECAICKLEYTKGDKLVTLPCAHNYHEKCIKTWLKGDKKCCICRNEVVV